MKPVNAIATQEKKELSKIVETKFTRLIDQATQSRTFAEGELFTKIAKKLRVDVIDKEIQMLEDKVKFLKLKKEQMGFETGYGAGQFTKKYVAIGKNRSEHVVDRATPAGRLYYALVKQEGAIEDLQLQKEEILTNMWLSSDREVVEKLVKVQPKMPVLAIASDIK